MSYYCVLSVKKIDVLWYGWKLYSIMGINNNVFGLVKV